MATNREMDANDRRFYGFAFLPLLKTGLSFLALNAPFERSLS